MQARWECEPFFFFNLLVLNVIFWHFLVSHLSSLVTSLIKCPVSGRPRVKQSDELRLSNFVIAKIAYVSIDVSACRLYQYKELDLSYAGAPTDIPTENQVTIMEHRGLCGGDSRKNVHAILSFART